MIGVLQGIIATATPWVVAHLIAPGEPLWSAIALVVPVAYALLHAREVLAWLAPFPHDHAAAPETAGEPAIAGGH